MRLQRLKNNKTVSCFSEATHLNKSIDQNQVTKIVRIASLWDKEIINPAMACQRSWKRMMFSMITTSWYLINLHTSTCAMKSNLIRKRNRQLARIITLRFMHCHLIATTSQSNPMKSRRKRKNQSDRKFWKRRRHAYQPGNLSETSQLNKMMLQKLISSRALPPGRKKACW